METQHHVQDGSRVQVGMQKSRLLVQEPAIALGVRLRQARWLMVILLIGFMLWSGRGVAQAYQVYVPLIPGDKQGPGGTGDIVAPCSLNEQEAMLADLLVNHPDQKRINPVCDPILAQVARARAHDMAQRSYFAHVNPDGNGPNFLVNEAGFALPDWYPDDRDANNIESIAGGHPTSADAWAGWLKSDGHRPHLLGTHGFYAGQTAYGVGYFHDPNSHFKHYWVFLSAPIEETE
jgi:hypothetical protein